MGDPVPDGSPSIDQIETARTHLLKEIVDHIQDALSSSPSGVLLTGIDIDALRRAVQVALPQVRFQSCCKYVAGEKVEFPSLDSSPLCLEDVDIPGSEVEPALRGVFASRLPNDTILGIATSERQIPSSLLRADRFEKVLRICAPSFSARKAAWREITISLRANNMLLDVPENADAELAAISPGYSLKDFTHIMYTFIARIRSSAVWSQNAYRTLEEAVGSHKPFSGSSDLDFIMSSATSPGTEPILGDGWGRCGGYKEVKELLIRFCEWPVRYRETFERLGVEPPRGVLLHGPRGCGKTMLALAFLHRLKHANWLHVNAPDLFSKYLGDSEARVRALFDRARSLSPCIVFIDELDVIGGTRQRGGDDGGGSGVEGRVLGSLLAELDGVGGGDVFVLACTSSLEVIDAALIRPGRLDHLLEIERPELEDRVEILRLQLCNMPVGAAKGDEANHASVVEDTIREVADGTKGLSGADLQSVCREAVVIAMEEESDPSFVSRSNFSEATKRVCNRTGTTLSKQP